MNLSNDIGFIRQKELLPIIGFSAPTLWRKVKAGIDEKLYDAVEIDWKLTGPLQDIVENDTVILSGVASTNERVIRTTSINFPGLDKYVTNFIEFSTYSPLCPQEFKQRFGYLTN